MARWLEVLAQYDFEIQHRLGLKHQNTDSLSRKYEKKDTQDNDNCSECNTISEDWEDFLDEVDNVVDLQVSVSAHCFCRVLIFVSS